MLKAIARTLTCSALLAAIPLPAAADTLRVGKAGAEAFSFVPADIGQHTGIFKKHGLDLTISAFGGDAKLQQAMAADGIDIGLGSGPGMAFIVKGAPVKGVAAMADQPLIFALVVRNDGSVKTASDLKGRKVGVSGVGSVTNWIITEISNQHGWGVEGIARVGLGSDANRVAALKTKSIDAAIVNIAVATKYVQTGEGKVLLTFGDLVKDFHIHVIFATNKAIAEKPQAVRGFLAGWFETITSMRSNKAKTVEIAKQVMRTDDATTSTIYDAVMPMFNEDGHFKPKALAALARSYVALKTLPQEPDMSKLYTEAFLPKK
ncbi:MAG: transporter substrate-binding domain-containing protein [Rhizobiales bacterium]|nr:transporter substrate-binding domain-containing protein [Hyphomicrobiales bacterium]